MGSRFASESSGTFSGDFWQKSKSQTTASVCSTEKEEDKSIIFLIQFCSNHMNNQSWTQKMPLQISLLMKVYHTEQAKCVFASLSVEGKPDEFRGPFGVVFSSLNVSFLYFWPLAIYIPHKSFKNSFQYQLKAWPWADNLFRYQQGLAILCLLGHSALIPVNRLF